MKKPSLLKEMFVLRTVACVSIVVLHSIGIGFEALKEQNVSAFALVSLDYLKLFLYYGTPLFVFISEFILAYSYKGRELPNGFLRKRLKFIFVPFIVMALFYSIPYATSVEAWSIKVAVNLIIGDYHGYFILIIFQFYLLHLLLHKLLERWKPSIVLTTSFLLNAGYLALFNFTEPPTIPYGNYIWERFYWIPFMGWVFYFSVGYYCGQNYHMLKEVLFKHKNLVLITPLISTGILFFLYQQGIVDTHSSKRIDILFHTIAVGFLLMYISSRLTKIPKLIVWISQYSFGIYLLHMFYQAVLMHTFPPIFFKNGLFFVITMSIASILSSMATVYYFSKLKYGHLVVGKIGVGYKNIPPIKPDPVRLIKKAYYSLVN